MTEVERRGRTYNGVNMEVETMHVLTPGEKEIVYIVHDEATFYCNEGKFLF